MTATETLKCPRRVLCAGLAAIAGTVGIAACASSSDPITTAPASHRSEALKFAECMRSHGVPNFPDPSSGGGIQLPSGSGINPFSPAFKTAQHACVRLFPGAFRANQHPTAEKIATARQTSVCMRRHGVTDFPDPTLKPPANPAGYSILEDRGGVILAVPNTINPESPVFVQAAKLCRFS